MAEWKNLFHFLRTLSENIFIFTENNVGQIVSTVLLNRLFSLV